MEETVWDRKFPRQLPPRKDRKKEPLRLYISGMKIEFDKAILWLLPYLYLVSTAYYWGYWGHFDIDAFNYYPISDLIKGITSPILQTILFSTEILAFLLFLRFVVEDLFQRSPVVIIVIFGLLAVLSTYILTSDNPLYYFSDHKPGDTEAAERWLILIAIGNIISIVVHGRLPKLDKSNDSFRFIIINFLVLLPCRASVDGYTKAIHIKNDSSFDYVITDSLATKNKALYKYLGKAGDYYILSSLDNLKKIVIPTEKLSPLVTENMSIDDSASVQRFKAHIVDLKSSI
jgi:hypothetical protein